jgi:hypothetical protein
MVRRLGGAAARGEKPEGTGYCLSAAGIAATLWLCEFIFSFCFMHFILWSPYKALI